MSATTCSASRDITCQPARYLRTTLAPALTHVLDRLDDIPAMVATDLGETLAQNRIAVALFGDYTASSGPARSIIYRWFTDPGGDPRCRNGQRHLGHA
jgi:hypothetical protein